MANIGKLLRKSQEIDLPQQEKYVLKGTMGYYLFQGAGILFVAGVLFYALFIEKYIPMESWYYLLIFGVMLLYGLLCIVAAFTNKVTFDEQKISIPGGYPFMSSKLEWENIARAELTGVITYRSYISLIFKKIFSSIFANPELHVELRYPEGMPKANFAVLQHAADKAMALRIIQEKLGDRFTVYSKDND